MKDIRVYLEEKHIEALKSKATSRVTVSEHIRRALDQYLEKPGRKVSAQPKITHPTVQEVSDYCRQRKNSVNPQAFVDFYASKGWKVGNTKMKDWEACVRTWESRDKSKSTGKIGRAIAACEKAFKDDA